VLQGTSIRSLQLHSAYAYACEACPPDWVDDKCLTEMGGRHHSLTNLIRWFQPHNWIGALLLSQVTLDRCLPGPKRNIGSYVYLSPRYPQKKKDQGTVFIPGSILAPLPLSIQRLAGPAGGPGYGFLAKLRMWYIIMHLFLYRFRISDESCYGPAYCN
jgi:hypothetical protein